MMARVLFIIIVIKIEEEEAKYFNYTSRLFRACKVPWSHDEITNVCVASLSSNSPDITAAAAQVIGSAAGGGGV